MAPDASDALEEREKVQHFLNAARTGNLDLLKKLAQQLDDGKGLAQTVVDVKDANKRGALHFAAREGQSEVCKYLLEELKMDVNTPDEDGETPLAHAAKQGHTSLAKYLVDHGADPSIPSGSGATALHHSAGIGDIELLKFLLSKDVNVESQSDTGTPLIWAAGHSRQDSVKILLEHNANPNAKIEDYITPLLVAVAAGSLPCLELLIKAGATVNFTSGGATPLHIAADIGCPEIINCLLPAGADPNSLDEDGMKPVQIAAARGNKVAVDILLPVTARIESIPEWNVDGILQYMQQETGKEEIDLNISLSSPTAGDLTPQPLQSPNTRSCLSQMDNFSEAKWNYDENEDTEIVKKLVDLKAELRQSCKEKLDSATSYESRMNEFIPPVHAAIKHYFLQPQECIGRRKISKRGEQEHITCTSKRRRQKCPQESMDLSLSNLEYGKLDFLRENKEEEKLYSNNNVKEKISRIMLRNFMHKSSHPLKNAASEYLLHVQLDTSVAQEFCCLLSRIFQEKKVKIIDPLCWQLKMQKGARSKSAQPINAKNYDKVLIGIVANNHFFSIHVHVIEHQIFIMDSMARDSQEFYEVHLTVLLNDMLFHDKIGKEVWKFFRVNNSPQQDNAYDCGVFMLKTMEYWAKGEKLPFTRAQTDVARHILMWEVVHQKLADSSNLFLNV